MNEIFTPLSDTLFPSPWNVRYTTFRFGPMMIDFVLKDMRRLPEDVQEVLRKMENFDTKEPIKFSKYCMFIIVNDEFTYLFYQNDDKAKIWKKFAETIQDLKEGLDLEIRDEQGLFQRMLISYKGINWIW